MKPSFRRLRGALAVVTTAALLAACSGGSYSDDDGSTGGDTAAQTLRIGWGLEVLSLDPPNESGIMGIGVLHNVYETLVKYDFGSAAIQPGLAKSWEISPDGKTYTFQLDPAAKFADGGAVTSADVKFSLERVVAWPEAVQGFQIAPSLAGATIETPDPATVRIVLAKPVGPFLAALTGTAASVVSEKLVTAAGSDVEAQRAWLKNNTAGSGPYQLDKWEPNSFLTLKRNDNYRAGKARYQSVQIQFIKESSQQVAALKQGDLDVGLDILPKQADELQNAGGFQLSEGTDLSTYYLAMNMDVAPFDKPQVREAVKYAIDYDGIINGLLSGRAVKAGGVIAEGLVGYDASLKDKYGRDVNRAKSLLAEAGLPNGFTFDMYLVNDTVKGLGVPTPTLASKLQADLKEVGITANLQVQDVNTLFPTYRTGKLPSILWYFGPTYPDPDPIVSPHGDWDTQATTRVNFNNPNLTAQIQQARVLVDADQRAGIYQTVGQEVAQNGPYAFMFRPRGSAVVREGVEGFAWTPIWTIQLS
jgi:peptide/nickel transport system substrate-binding protein